MLTNVANGPPICTPEIEDRTKTEIGAEYKFSVIYLRPDQVEIFKANRMQTPEDLSANIQTFNISK